VVSPDRPASRGEGPSSGKGKGVDPTNWGNADLYDSDLNVETQRAILHDYKSAHRRKTVSADRHLPVPRRASVGAAQLALPAVSRPAAQINPRSYLGVALGKSSSKKSKRRARSPSSSSSSSTDTSSSSSSSSSESSSSSDSSSSQSRSRRSRRHRSRRKKAKTSKSKTKSGYKSFKPKDYNGTADLQLYSRFVKETRAYIKDARVKSSRRAFAMSYFMTGKAYDFYIQKVSLDEENWDLDDIFTGLFNYCFPPDFKSQLRAKLNRIYQNSKSVTEYSHELEECFNILGDIPPRAQVIKLWDGFRDEMKSALYLDKLNPEISSWDEVHDAALIIEMAESVGSSKRHKKTDLAPTHSGSGASNHVRFGGSNSNRRSRFGSSQRPTLAPTALNGMSHLNSNSGNSTRDNRSQSVRSNRSQNRSTRSRSNFDPKKSNNHRKFERKDTRDTPKPSSKEENDRKALGNCFKCGEPGHFS